MSLHEHVDESVVCPTCEVRLRVETTPHWRDRRVVSMGVSAVLFSLGVIFEFLLKLDLVAEILFLTVSAISGFEVVRGGVHSLLFQRRLSIDLLMTVAAAVSFFIGHGEEGAAILLLFSLAEFLEDRAGERARRSIALLTKLAPETAVVKRKGLEARVHVHDVKINDTVVVRPGEKIPLDGEVLKGVSSVNQAPITGESMPVTKEIGDQVYAGTINNEGYLEVKVAKRPDETMLSKVVKLVEEAQRIKSPTEKFVEKFSKVYTPAVILLAMGVAVIPTIAFGLPLTEWLYKALVVLVVSCPCALAISTPVAMVSSITSAARNGVLIKGSSYVEEVGKVKVFAFDKTGTLTEGSLEVTEIVGFGRPREEVLLKAACIEALSEHPIAKAIVKEGQRWGRDPSHVNADDFKAIAGKGATCKVDGAAHYVGSGRMFNELSIRFPEERVWELESEGKTVVLVGDEREAIGMIAVMDRVRENANKSISELRRRGIRTEMVTGDNERIAKAIASKIGIDEFHAALLPDEKVITIGRHLATDYGRVAMVGDGVNDAPALASADVGIAMGAMGSYVSLETADIALIQDDLSKLPYLIDLSEKTMEVVKQNIVASILIKASLAILAFPGLVTLWLAVAIGDMGLSLAVILNSMRLLLTKPINLD